MEQPAPSPLPGLSLLLGILGAVLGLILIHRMWQAIQAGPARTTPGKAVGFLFIPCFNLYWIFVALWGWAMDYNQFIRSRGIRAPGMPQQLALILCILVLVGGLGALAASLLQVAALGVLIVAAIDVVAALYFWEACKCINDLARTPPQLLTPSPTGVGQTQAGTNGMAVAAFVMSLVGIVCIGVLLEPLAIVFALIARKQMLKSGARRGWNLATAAGVIGIIGFVLSLIGLILLILPFLRGVHPVR